MRLRVSISFLLLLFTLAACSSEGGMDDDGESCTVTPVPYPDALTQRGAVRDVHDPVLIKDNGRYYLFSTGHGIPMRRSDDLVQWTPAGQVYAALPSWAASTIAGVEFPWAPDVAFFNDTYYLYYSLSTFGGQRSAIGLATNSTLDATSPGYEWVDQGLVIESRPGLNDFNAIDPNVVFDEAGTPWLAWGSFWSGIKMRRLDARTGLPSDEDDTVYALAARPVETAIEAPFIVRRDGLYYLFVSFDRCCQGTESTYKIMVGRSASVTGPYVDQAGRSMMQGGGTLVLTGYGRIRGPGHNAVFVEGDRHYLVHHFYDAEDGGTPTLQVRSLLWDEGEWPLAGEPYDGVFPTAETPSSVVGAWAHSVDFGPSFRIDLLGDGRVERCNEAGTWTLDGSTLTLRWASETGAVRVERLLVASDGTWYVGRTDDDKMIRGARVEGS